MVCNRGRTLRRVSLYSRRRSDYPRVLNMRLRGDRRGIFVSFPNRSHTLSSESWIELRAGTMPESRR